MKLAACITYRGVELDCRYDYTPACPATRTEPKEPEYVEIEAVLAGGVDIEELLDDRVWKEIKALVLAAHHAEEEAA